LNGIDSSINRSKVVESTEVAEIAEATVKSSQRRG